MIRMVRGKLHYKKHQDALIHLLDFYMKDPMGLGSGFNDKKKDLLIQGLRNNPSLILFFAKYHQEYIGMAVCFEGFSTFSAKKLINIHDLIVSPHYRKKGIGRKILDEVIHYGKKNDFCKITLEVRVDNLSAQRLYQSMGFGEVDVPMKFWIKELQNKKSLKF